MWYAIKQFIVSDPSRRGHWYEIGEVFASSKREAILARWSDGHVPYGYKVEEK